MSHGELDAFRLLICNIPEEIYWDLTARPDCHTSAGSFESSSMHLRNAIAIRLIILAKDMRGS